jgi:anti-sigma B factor antagonist
MVNKNAPDGEITEEHIFKLPEALDTAAASEWNRILCSRLRNPATENLIIDASGLKHIDSAGIGVLVFVHAEAKNLGKGFIIVNMRAEISALLSETRIDNILHEHTP